MRIVRKHTGHESPHGINFFVWDRLWLAAAADNFNHTRHFLNREPLLLPESHETIPGEERHIDFLLTILPLAQTSHRRQERFDALLIQLTPHQFLVTRPRTERVPTKTVLGVGLVCLVHLVYFVYPVCLVCLVLLLRKV